MFKFMNRDRLQKQFLMSQNRAKMAKEGKLGGSVLCLVTQSCPTLCEPLDCSLPDYSVHGDSPGKNTRVGCHALLSGIFPS